MKNVYPFWFESDQLKSDFKFACQNESMTMQNRITYLIQKDIKFDSIRQYLKIEYLNNRITPDEYNKKLKVIEGENIQPENLNALETI